MHQPNKRGPLGPVCICRDFVIWHSAHGVDWVEAGHRAQLRHSNSVQNTLGDQCGDAQRCVEGCVKVRRGVWRCMEVHGGAQKGVQGGVQAMKGQVGKKAGLCGSAWVPRSWKLGKMVWWAHRKYSNHRIIGATRAGLW